VITRTGPNRFLVLAAYVALVIAALLIVGCRPDHATPAFGSTGGSGVPVQQTQYAGPEGF